MDENSSAVPAKSGRGVAMVEALENRQLLSVAVALASRNQLLTFDTTSPQIILQTARVRGLAPRETLVGIDFRPATGELFGVGTTSRLYRIDAAGGRATAVGGPFSPALNGEQVGVDFNPATDRLRVVTGVDQNLEIDPNTGAATAQTDLAFAAGDPNAGVDPDVVALAFSSNTAGTTSTTLWGLEATTNNLVRVGSPGGTPQPPESGQVLTAGPLGVDPPPGTGGFDIVTEPGGGGDTAFVVFPVEARQPSQLFSVDLGTGTATTAGEIGRRRQQQAVDIAVAPRGLDVVGVTARNELVRFNSAVPHVLVGRTRLDGLPRRERVRAIDFREATGALYALTTGDRLYSIDPASGATTPVGGASALELDRRAEYAMDFNPVTGELRVVNTADQNARYNPTTGEPIDFNTGAEGVQPDVGLTFIANDVNQGSNPSVVGLAHVGAAGGAGPTVYGIDSNRNVLVRLGSPGGLPVSPDNGQLATVGQLGTNAGQFAGFDIRQVDGTDRALGAFTSGGGRDGLYAIDLGTGEARFIGGLNRQARSVRDITIVGP